MHQWSKHVQNVVKYSNQSNMNFFYDVAIKPSFQFQSLGFCKVWNLKCENTSWIPLQYYNGINTCQRKSVTTCLENWSIHLSPFSLSCFHHFNFAPLHSFSWSCSLYTNTNVSRKGIPLFPHLVKQASFRQGKKHYIRFKERQDFSTQCRLFNLSLLCDLVGNWGNLLLLFITRSQNGVGKWWIQILCI